MTSLLSNVLSLEYIKSYSKKYSLFLSELRLDSHKLRGTSFNSFLDSPTIPFAL